MGTRRHKPLRPKRERRRRTETQGSSRSKKLEIKTSVRSPLVVISMRSNTGGTLKLAISEATARKIPKFAVQLDKASKLKSRRLLITEEGRHGG